MSGPTHQAGYNKALIEFRYDTSRPNVSSLSSLVWNEYFLGSRNQKIIGVLSG